MTQRSILSYIFPGIHPGRWEDDVLEDMKFINIGSWKKVVQNVDSWKKVVEEAGTLCRLYLFMKRRGCVGSVVGLL